MRVTVLLQMMGGAGDWKDGLLNPRGEGSQLSLEALLTLLCSL